MGETGTGSAFTRPMDIEKQSMAIIEEEMGPVDLSPLEKAVLKRVIHTSADFDYVKNLRFLNNGAQAGRQALLAGRAIVTDTTMAASGISKATVNAWGCEVVCFIGDEEVRAIAERDSTTRAQAAVRKAAGLYRDAIWVVGNAPTALFEIVRLIGTGELTASLVVGMPVGFVNVTASKEALAAMATPSIVGMGRKGGSNVAASVINALAYGEGR